jgi:hypothetical protein
MVISKQVPGRMELQPPRTARNCAAAATPSNYRNRDATMSPPGPRPPPKV